MADRDDDHDEALLLDQTDDPVAADAIRPEIPFLALQRFAELARIARTDDPMLQKAQKTPLNRLVELAQVAASIWTELNPPGRGLS